MRALLLSCLLITSPVVSADPPEKKAEPPHAVLKFPDDLRKNPKVLEMTLEMTTASGAVYELRLNHGKTYSNYCDGTQRAAVLANWMSDRNWDSYTLEIYGGRTRESKGDPVKSLVLTNRIVEGKGELPRLESVGGVKVETREANPKANADPARKQRPAGPDVGKAPFVEFDFSTVPNVKCGYWEMTLRLQTEYKGEVYDLKFEAASDFVHDGGLGEMLVNGFNEASYKAELIGKTTIRVYGLTCKDRFYSPVKGSVGSPHLKPKELPKVTNPIRT